MSPPEMPRPHRPLLGIVLMCTASSLFPVMAALVQALGPRYGAEQLAWARQVSQLIVLFVLFVPTHGLQVLRSRHLGWQALRSAMLLSSVLFLYAGVKVLPLAKATSISLTGPFFVALLARPILGERLSWPRLLAIAIGFAGALLIIRPGSEMFHWASLLLLGASLSYALFQILTRFVGSHDKPETSALYSVLLGALVLSLYMPYAWTPIQSWSDGALMLLLGMLGGIGHYCVARALIYAQANLVAPFVYWQLIMAIVVGYLVSRQLPDIQTSIGAAIIVAAGLVLGWRETRERRAAEVAGSGLPALESGTRIPS
jgi:drug/metabolite transporter (DMT)-like permease